MRARGLAQVTAALRDPGWLSAVGLALLVPASLIAAALIFGLPLWLVVGPAVGMVAGTGAAVVAALVATCWWMNTIARMIETGAEPAAGGRQ